MLLHTACTLYASVTYGAFALWLTNLERSSKPYVWTWIGTPVITGTHVYTFTVDACAAVNADPVAMT